jgi:hypothetical protein
MKTRRVPVWAWLALSIAGLVACGSSGEAVDSGPLDSSADAPTGSDATIDGSDGASPDVGGPMGDVTINEASTSLDAGDAASITDSDATSNDGSSPSDGPSPGTEGGSDAPSDVDAVSGVDASIDAGGVDAGDSGASPGLTLTMDRFSVGANREVKLCQQIGNPFGTDVDIISMDGYVEQGVTAFFLDNMAPSTSMTSAAPVQNCASGLTVYPFPYLSQQTGHFIVDYPTPTMGYRLAATHGLMFQVHVINAGSQPISPTVSITIRTPNAGVVTTHVGTILMQNSYVSIPPNTSMTSPKTFTQSVAPVGASSTPAGYSIFTSWGWMDKWGISMTASTNGTDFYGQSTYFQPPIVQHNPVLSMLAGQTITWTCQEYNTTAATVPFGDSDITNTRCVYIGQYYPAADPANPDLLSLL